LLTDLTLQDVSVPVETKNSGGAHVHEHRKLTLDIERGWANGTTVKFARRAQDVTGNIVVKLQQVLFETASLDCPALRVSRFARLTFCRQVPHESFSRDGDNLHVTGAIHTP
jgi:DnaJ-class molecular chaperone